MNEKMPVPIDKLPLYTKRGMFEEYYNIVVSLTNTMADVLRYRHRYDRDTGEDLSHLGPDEIFDREDDDTRWLGSVKGEASDFLDILGATLQEEGEAMYRNHEAELGEWIESLIYHKQACEDALFDLDDEIAFATNRNRGEA